MPATTTQSPMTVAPAVLIRPLRQDDVDTADQIMRTAFGTFLGAPEPLKVFGDIEYVRPRFAARPGCAFAAECDGDLAGSNFATRWGSFGFFGPLTVRPDLWHNGIASRLMQPVIDLFDSWHLRQAGLFTFPHSPRHIGLYQKFGFWPQQLTPLMAKQAGTALGGRGPLSTYSTLSQENRTAALASCRELTDAIFGGLDLADEIGATEAQRLGDTVLLDDGEALDGFAVCHCGAGEAGSGTCFVKFGAVRSGPQARARFERLLDDCERLASARGLGRIVAGVNTARHDAYCAMLDRGYRTWLTGIVMQRPNQPGYCRPDAYVIDDLR